MKTLLLSVMIFFMLVPYVFTQDAQTIKFDLFLKYSDNGNYKMSIPYSLAFDKKESVYILDLKECSILKFDVNGKFITSIGKKGRGLGEIQSPAGISVKDNNIYLIEWLPIINVYNTSGEFISTKSKQKTSVQEIREFPEKFFIGTVFNPAEMSVSLREYDWAGKMIKFIDKIDYGHFFTKKELSTTRNIVTGRVETLTYCINSKGEILYAKSNKYEIKKFIDGKMKVIISENRKAKKLPNMNGVKTQIVRSKKGSYLEPIGDSYNLVKSLMTDIKDNIWFCTTSEDRSGFVKYSADGKYKAFYKVNPYLLTDVRYFMSRDYIYYIHHSSEKIEIYRAAIPK